MTIHVSQEEYFRLAGIITALGGNASQLRIVTMAGEPHSKERARHARRGRFVKTYQPKSDELAEARTAALLHKTIAARYTGNVCVAGIFYRSTRQEVDYDNLLKHVGDAANSVIWVDDAQVTAGAGVIELDSSHPRTLLAFAPHRSSMLRGTDAVKPCEACGEDFPLSGLKRFCGVKCAAKGRRKDFVPFPLRAKESAA